MIKTLNGFREALETLHISTLYEVKNRVLDDLHGLNPRSSEPLTQYQEMICKRALVWIREEIERKNQASRREFLP